jgi:hypothetical protein
MALQAWGVDIEDNPDDVYPTMVFPHREANDEEKNSRHRKRELIVQTLLEEGIDLSPEIAMSIFQLVSSPLKAEEAAKRLRSVLQAWKNSGLELTPNIIITILASTY